MPNKDSSNKNISIEIPKSLKKRMDLFIKNEKKKSEKIFTKRQFIVNAGNEYMKDHGEK